MKSTFAAPVLVLFSTLPLFAAEPTLATAAAPAAAAAPAQAAPAAAPSRKPLSTTAPAASTSGPFCSGAYADDLQSLAPRVREFERQQTYTYCVRNTAVYECLSYGADGNLRRVRKRAVLHGTAFGYKQNAGETLLATNQHVAEWPAVTDDEHTVDGVPAGCKKVSETLRIVDGEADAYERDDVGLTRVVADQQLDVAVLKAHALLPVLPWKLGHSAQLRERNVVEVRGFPLAASFHATNVGKVVSAFDHDSYREWEHDDFVIDALLSSGNSGSPVMAVSCATGELELVGIFHAGYSEGSALNVVVGIDQVRDLLTTLKRAKRSSDGAVAFGAGDRTRLSAAVLAEGDHFFPFGGLTALVRERADGALIFELMSRDFPLMLHPILLVEDLPIASSSSGASAQAEARGESFGELGRVWFGGPTGLKRYARADLDGDAQAQVTRLLETLRHDAIAAFDYRTAARDAQRSRERFDHMARLERALKRTVAAQRDQAQAVSDLADRLAPHALEPQVTIADAFSAPAPPPAPPAAAHRRRPIADRKPPSR